jgi:uncharacterized protein YbjT (DUF2867 family)
MPATRTILLTGATGYIGGRLLPVLLEHGHRVRCLVRGRAGSCARLPAGAEIVHGDVQRPETLGPALHGVDVAFYLVHSMGGDGDFADADRRAARAFGDAARAAGTPRVIYLGGLEGNGSEHLRSREEVAELLAERVPGTVHARAAMVIGGGSASFRMLRHLVDRLPLMVVPRWVDTRTQPIAIADLRAALAALATHDDPPHEVQLGGADVLSYGQMMRRYAGVAGRRRPRMVPVPVLSPRLSSYWVSFVTPVGAGLARPLVQGLSTEMLVRTSPPAGINDAPLGFDDAVRQALAEVRA